MARLSAKRTGDAPELQLIAGEPHPLAKVPNGDWTDPMPFQRWAATSGFPVWDVAKRKSSKTKLRSSSVVCSSAKVHIVVTFASPLFSRMQPMGHGIPSTLPVHPNYSPYFGTLDSVMTHFKTSLLFRDALELAHYLWLFRSFRNRESSTDCTSQRITSRGAW